MNEEIKKATSSISNSNNNSVEDNANNTSSKKQKINKRTLYYAIDQYLKAMREMSAYKAPENLSYSALTSLGALPKGFSTENALNEFKLLKDFHSKAKSDKQNKFSHSMQKIIDIGKYSPCYFHHLSKNSDCVPSYRIYLNCQNKNISAIAEQFMKYADILLDDYYFKIMTFIDCQISQRYEKFVFYAKDERQLREIISLLTELKKRYPDLFIGSENVNPFYETKNGFLSVAKEFSYPCHYLYKGFRKKEEFSTSSANTVLSYILEDSMLDSIDKLMISNPHFNRFAKNMISADNADDTKLYVDLLLPKIMGNRNLYANLLSNMCNDLNVISELVPDLCIKGIPTNSILNKIENNNKDKDKNEKKEPLPTRRSNPIRKKNVNKEHDD